MIIVFATMPNYDDKMFMLSIYQDYYGLIRKTVYNIAHSSDNIEDLINDIFLKLMERTSLLQTLDSCKLATYIVYTSKSVAINFLKHRDVQNRHTYYGDDLDIAEKIPGLEESIENRIIQQEAMEEMGSAILRLPEKEKELLYFKYFLEMDNNKLAEIIGIAPASVRQYLTRARRKVKKLIDKGMNKHVI